MSSDIIAITILNSSANRICSRYYTTPPGLATYKEQCEFESELLQKSGGFRTREDCDILTVGDYTCVYFARDDVALCVVGKNTANELILEHLCQGVYSALEVLFGDEFNRDSIVEELGTALILLDEAADGGVVFESDCNVLVQRTRAQLEAGEVPQNNSGGLSGLGSLGGLGNFFSFNSAVEQTKNAMAKSIFG